MGFESERAMHEHVARIATAFGGHTGEAWIIAHDVHVRYRVPDVIAARLDLRALDDRLAAGLEGSLDASEAAALVALRFRAWVDLDVAAQRMSVGTAHANRTLRKLAQKGFVQKHPVDPSRFRRENAARFITTRIVAFEAKLKDWRGALDAALALGILEGGLDRRAFERGIERILADGLVPAAIEYLDSGALAAAAGLAVEGGTKPGFLPSTLLVIAVLVASAAAGAFNQYVERDLDVKMARTKNRPFVTGSLKHGPFWLWVIGAMTATSVLATVLASNWLAAAYVFLGAFTYGVVYTVWLKRRTWWNIVVGGLAGSFAVLAGAAAVSAAPGPEALALAVVLFLWTPPHFWSLAIACRNDYAAAGVPMLPVVVGDARAARAILASASLLVLASFVPGLFGLGAIYLASAAAGGAFFLLRCKALVQRPGREAARAAFLASLVQLSAVLFGAMADVALL